MSPELQWHSSVHEHPAGYRRHRANDDNSVAESRFDLSCPGSTGPLWAHYGSDHGNPPSGPSDYGLRPNAGSSNRASNANRPGQNVQLRTDFDDNMYRLTDDESPLVNQVRQDIENLDPDRCNPGDFRRPDFLGNPLPDPDEFSTANSATGEPGSQPGRYPARNFLRPGSQLSSSEYPMRAMMDIGQSQSQDDDSWTSQHSDSVMETSALGSQSQARIPSAVKNRSSVQWSKSPYPRGFIIPEDPFDDIVVNIDKKKTNEEPAKTDVFVLVSITYLNFIIVFLPLAPRVT